MGQDIYNLILGDNYGVPSLPLFIGNYLLDLLSSFFPIFLIMASFVMVYTAFIRGMGDWKQTAVAISPTLISITVILGMLSMKTPSKNEGEFWKDTNSYTVVEMMTAFLGFGGMFADALTHKIIYGNLDVREGNNPKFDGYFPNALQTMSENNKKKNEDTIKLLKEAVSIEDFEQEIAPIEQEIAADLKMLIYNLEAINFVPNVFRMDGLEASKRNFIGYDHNTEQSVLFIPQKENKESNNINIATAINDISKDVFSFKTQDILDKYNAAYQADIYVTDKIVSYVPIVPLDYTKQQSVKDMTNNLVNPSSYDIEFAISTIVKKYVYLKIREYDFYDRKIKEAMAIHHNVNTTRNTYLKSIIAQSELKRDNAKNFLKIAVKLEKDMGLILKNIYRVAYNNYHVSDINRILGSNFFESIKPMEYLGEEFEKKVSKSYIDLLTFSIPKSLRNNDSTKEQERIFNQYLNSIFQIKAKVSNDLLNEVYDFSKMEAMARPVELPRRSTFVLATMSNEAGAKLEKSDNERKKIMKEYVDTIAGEVNVSKALQKTIDEKYKDLGSDVIYWFDLGKYYGVFKNLYSPVMTNIISIGEVNKVDSQRTEELIEFLKAQESESKNNRVMNAALIVGGAQMAVGLLKITPVGKFASKILGDEEEKSTKNKLFSLFGDFLDAISTIGLAAFAIFFLNTILPSTIWMFAMITYYIEMAVYVAVFPIAFMFMIFQSYRQSLVQYMNILIGLILYPVVLVSLYFIVLYVDLLIPMFLKHFLPFFAGYDEFKQSFMMVFGGTTASNAIGTVGGAAMEFIGNFIYTAIGFILSSLLILTWLRAHEYMSKILNVSILGQDSFNGRDTVNKFGSLETFKSGNLTRV